MRRTHIGLALSVSTLLAVLILTEHGGTIQTHAASLLNRIPTDCPTGSPRTVPGLRHRPKRGGLWSFPVAGLAFGPHATLQYSTNAQALRLSWRPPYGWIHKMLWFMNPASRDV
jgi:hypothetical protein